MTFSMCAQAAEVRVVSVNLARTTDPAQIARELADDGELKNADIVLLQEVAGQTKETNVAEAVAKRLGYLAVAIPSSSEAPDQGLAILSKQPLSDVKVIPLKRYDLRFHSRVRFALAATVGTIGGVVRVWNVHLDSRINADERVEQLKPVLEDARGYARGVIGGDLNTTHFQWLLNVLPASRSSAQVRAVRSAFEKEGFKTPMDNELVTFPFLGQHLDWIFARGLAARDSSVAPVEFSDHHAVWVTLESRTAAMTR